MMSAVRLTELSLSGYINDLEPDLPGVFSSEYGWISPAGDWYSCGFGGHDVKSRMLAAHLKLDKEIAEFTERIEEGTPWGQMRKAGLGPKDPYIHAREFLVESGWVRVHDEDNCGYLTAVCKAQMNELQVQTFGWMLKQFRYLLDTEVTFDGYKLAFKV
ncbi:hypothetical protein GZH47_33400 (plasmid) [Paenibacillus rhizovicinus]|uniref:Uncharacterized protein n=1 Tax=Paenibacillus rhizovicinus TaxID=2704463 RepID=A0A6C0PBL6_9BACL|nr:hypothetical protein [Paenibacillus rhizovicinus]QHW35791.1 hypothetical protein GZH47_33400 [Paenibacillus rhizovicinus]